MEIADGATGRRAQLPGERREAARELPGFRYQWTAPKGAAELVSAYRAAGMTRDEFDGPRFKRLAWLRGLLDSGELAADLRWRSAGAPVGAVAVPA